MEDKVCAFHIDLNYCCLREEYIRKWLVKIASAGYNAILWEIEDKVQLDSCPECIYPEALTKEQFRSILDYSSELGLEAIPLLQTVGHGEYILMHEEYRCLRESQEENHHDCYCTENPEARKFLKQLIREYLELFGDIRYFHLGGDEAYVFATCPKCAAKAAAIGKNALYMEHITDIAQDIFRAGVRPGIWGDMILRYPEAMNTVPKNYLIWDWNYQHTDSVPDETLVWGEGSLPKEKIPVRSRELFPEIIDEDGRLRPFYTAHALKRMGYDVILCSAVRAAGDSPFVPVVEIHSGNVAGAARLCARLGLVGNCVTSWAIRLNPFEVQEPLLPLAPKALRNPEMPLGDLESRVSKELFGLETTDFYSAAALAGRDMPPLLCGPTMAVQWNRLKDSLPTPPGYLKKQLAKWKTENDGAFFDTLKKRLEDAEDNTVKASSRLEKFAMQATKGFAILDNWLEALRLQFWMIKAAKMIFYDQVTPETVHLLEVLKNRYVLMLGKIETPQSAAKNASLVFDWILEYCRDCLRHK